MASITWDSTTPTQISRATNTDDVIRSDLATIATGIGSFAYWPGSAASAGDSTSSSGQFIPNTARLSDVSLEAGTDSIASDGFLSLHTKPGVNFSRLRHIGSSGSFLIAHPVSLEHIEAPETAPFKSRWVMRSGTAVGLGGDEVGVHLVEMGITYSGKPAVISIPSSNSVIVAANTLAASSNFSSRYSNIRPDGGTPSYDLHWISLGTVAF